MLASLQLYTVHVRGDPDLDAGGMVWAVRFQLKQFWTLETTAELPIPLGFLCSPAHDCVAPWCDVINEDAGAK
jgi:hypothetical protein